MKKTLFLPIIVIILAAASCSRLSGDATVVKFTVEHPCDSFLVRFVEFDGQNLKPTIDYYDAVRAGATNMGYGRFVQEVALVDSTLSAKELKQWAQSNERAKGVLLVKSDMQELYNVEKSVRRDKFMQYFFEFDGDSLYLNLTRERAILMGASSQGYDIMQDAVREISHDIAVGTVPISTVRENFEENRKRLYNTATRMPTVSACAYERAWTRTVPQLQFQTDMAHQLRNFVTVTNGVYTPELAQSDAINLGASVDDYTSYIAYIKALNRAEKVSVLNEPRNLFLQFFLMVNDDGVVVLNITRERALRAGASIQGYAQALEMAASANSGMGIPDMIKGYREQLIEIRAKMFEFAEKNPSKSAVMELSTPPTAPTY